MTDDDWLGGKWSHGEELMNRRLEEESLARPETSTSSGAINALNRVAAKLAGRLPHHRLASEESSAFNNSAFNNSASGAFNSGAFNSGANGAHNSANGATSNSATSNNGANGATAKGNSTAANTPNAISNATANNIDMTLSPVSAISATGSMEGGGVKGVAASVQAQVDALIREAMCSENLCQAYIGWCAFW